MAVIHNTTMTPSKLQLLTAWLPGQPWYLNRGRTPELTKAGGFRLDDPRGDVGIEFMAVTDGTTAYHVPMTYRGRALDGADDDALIGTSEHGVLGQRFIYDGIHDPVLVAQLLALLQGGAKPQAQSESDTPDLTVTSRPVASGYLAAIDSVVAADGPLGTELRVAAADAHGGPAGQVSVRIHRILQPGDGPAHVLAPWQLPDGTQVRGPFVTADFVAAP